jgi:hypothetical protein
MGAPDAPVPFRPRPTRVERLEWALCLLDEALAELLDEPLRRYGPWSERRGGSGSGLSSINPLGTTGIPVSLDDWQKR